MARRSHFLVQFYPLSLKNSAGLRSTSKNSKYINHEKWKNVIFTEKLSKNFEKRVFIQVESKRMKGIRNKAAILVGVGHEPIPPRVIERVNLFCASGEKYKALVILRWWQYIEKMIKLGKRNTNSKISSNVK